MKHNRPFLHFAIAALALHTAPVADPPAPPAGGGAPPAGDPPSPPAGSPPAPPAPPVPPAKTPEEIKAEQVAAIKNVLTLPQDSTIDPAITERTAATLSALGLTPDNAPKVFELLTSELASHGTRAVDALKAAFQPGGAEWQKQQETFKAAALADPRLGAGKPEQLQAKVEGAKRVLATAFKDQPEKLAAIEQSGLFTNPDALALLDWVHSHMQEDRLVQPPGAGSGTPTEQQRLERLYPSMKKTT